MLLRRLKTVSALKEVSSMAAMKKMEDDLHALERD